MKVTVVGSGYVGSSNAVMLAKHNEVVLLDVSEKRVNCINEGKSPIEDEEITNRLKVGDLNLAATTDKRTAYNCSDYVIIAVPTDYNVETKFFNTSLVESVISDAMKFTTGACIVIKSTIPIGFVENMQQRFKTHKIIFSPEFLREGTALKDNLNPDRIIVGGTDENAMGFAQLLLDGAENTPEVLYMQPNEAESVKLFANSYLAMRVAFFNELDTFSEKLNLNADDIVRGVSLDARIGTHYNNPSFGYGGYCFPKDTKQLLANFEGVPNKLITAIVESNETRKDHITKSIMKMDVKTVGVYRLVMKSGSDNFRSSAIQDIIERLRSNNINVVIFEPKIDDTNFNGCVVVNNITSFAEMSDVIIANRTTPEIEDYREKIYTRDLFGSDS